MLYNRFYINGEWLEPREHSLKDIVNPATETVLGQVALGSPADIDRAVSAAAKAFESWSVTTIKERMALLDRIINCFNRRIDEMAEAISAEMGAPMNMARNSQAPMGTAHLEVARNVLGSFDFDETLDGSHVFREPVGVCGFITPWNWPVNQIACKVAPALACGCTMVLKPSELAPLSAQLFAEILHEAGVPAGVFNMVHGDGPVAGARLSTHPDVDMLSLTGSTRAGALVSKAAADTVKRVVLELGGKSANIILDDADFEQAVAEGAAVCFNNAGQSCNSPSRMLVPKELHDKAVEIAAKTANATVVGLPQDENTQVGPLSNAAQFNKVQSMIEEAIRQGTHLSAGGLGRPAGLEKGFFAKPTVFSNVSNDMMIAQEEVFGPVLAIIPYNDEEDAIKIANDSSYGLAGYVQSGNLKRARSVAKKLRAGTIFLNGNNYDANAPFGGYKQSGNGREWGSFGFHDFLEIKGVVGFHPQQ
ncbi:MAG: aldehyde dehydrogenase family protein [Pseudomonadales bacterium]|nr:aldehyde dehydrogenase family protein [Pseudomonadales bacterium]